MKTKIEDISKDLDDLDLEGAKSLITQLLQKIEILSEDLKHLSHRLYGKKSEQIDPNQLRLWGGDETMAALESSPEPSSDKPKKKAVKKGGHGRKAFADHLERERIECVLSDAERACHCGELMPVIGEEITERGHFIPGRMVVKQYVRQKCACSKGHGVKTAKPPGALIEKCKFEPSVYAHIATAKYGDHVPLNRLSGILKRQGFHLPRSTMWDMLKRVEELVGIPIFKQMKKEILSESFLSIDETPIKVKIKDQNGTTLGYLWAYGRGEKVIYDFTLGRSGQGPIKFLGKWRGTAQVDGYSGYDLIVETNYLIRAGCWAHARRKFSESLRSAKVASAQIMLLMSRLYWIESALRKRAKRDQLSEQEFFALRFQVRKRLSRSIVAKIEAMVDDFRSRRDLLPKSRIGKALTYLNNQRETLRVFYGDGRIDIDNNACERAMRPVAMGRRNYMLLGSPRGGQCAAHLYSLVTACKALEIDPAEYLEDVMTRIDSTPASEIASLTPWAWAEARSAVGEA